MACGQISFAIDSGVKALVPLMLAMGHGGRGGAVPPRKSCVVAYGPMENTEHNLSLFLAKIAHLLESRGCKTVGELLESGEPLPDDPTDRAKTMLQILRNLDYVALRFLADLAADPRALMDDESFL